MKKKLIEVALPLEAINVACAREKSIRHGHPSTLHLWWARRPLAAARAVIFSQLVDDPSGHPDAFPTEEAQEIERQRLFRLIEELVQWENSTNEEVLNRARAEILKSWRRTCQDSAGDSRVKDLFDPDTLPAFHDPFAGGGALPLEAQRLGLEAYASDLNPVAVLINKAMIEIPPRFARMPPVNPDSRLDKTLLERTWQGAQGLAADVMFYGKWMRDEAEKRIGHLYPKVEVTTAMTHERPELQPLVGKQLTVIAWVWARTVKSPNPAFAHIDVPLVSTFLLSTRPGKEVYIEPVIEHGTYRFTVRTGKPKNLEAVKRGTKAGGSHSQFLCLMSGTPMPFDYLRAEGAAGRLGTRLMAIIAEGDRARVYLPPTEDAGRIASTAIPMWKPDLEISHWPGRTNVVEYGLSHFEDLFTPRQLVALTTFSELVHEARAIVKRDANIAGVESDASDVDDKRLNMVPYAAATSVYFAFALDKAANYWSSICTWNSLRETIMPVFTRQAIPMVWDYVETNPFSDSSGNWMLGIEQASRMLCNLGFGKAGSAFMADAAHSLGTLPRIISTDPPYFDNISYADLSDFFYAWLRPSLKPLFPDLLATLSTPKSQELIASRYRHGGKEKAEAFFMSGMTEALKQIASRAHSAFPVTIYYAFKQAEHSGEFGSASTGWEVFLEALIAAGFAISGTWPMRTENVAHMKKDFSSLASSVVLVCRQRSMDALKVTRRGFVDALQLELPAALAHMQRGNIAPVDLAQAAIGPGMAVYTRFGVVLDAEGKAVSVREALTLINQTLDEVLAQQEGDFDADSRWAVAWFDQYGFVDGDYGVAETLSKAKNTSVDGLSRAGILTVKGRKVRLLRPAEFVADWSQASGFRFTTWEMLHQLIRLLESEGELAAGQLIAKLGGGAEGARELAYRLYTICERKKRAAEALSYNGLVQSWPEMMRLSREGAVAQPAQAQLFEER